MAVFESLLGFSDLGLFVLRLALAIIFIYHSLPKLKNPKAMAQGIGLPGWFIAVLGFSEFVSSIGLILGIYTQVAALILAIVMVGALYFKIVKWKAPFSAHDKLGWEYDIILVAACIALLLLGSGSIAVLP